MAEAAASTGTAGTETAAATQTAATSTAAATTTAAQTQATGVSTDWTTSLSEEMRGYVQTKGFKDPAAVLDSYRNFEKLHGVPQDRILKLPENLDSPEGRAILERLGAPKEAKEYKIEIPKEFGDEKMAEGLREVAYKNGFTHKQMENLVGWWNERTGAQNKTFTEDHQTKMTQENDGLKKEWGAAYDQNKEIANQAARRFGLDNDMLMGLAEMIGPAKAFKGLYDLGVKSGEAKFVVGQTAGGEVMAPAHAKARIEELKADPTFVKRYSSGEGDAVRQWNKLNEQAWGAPAR